jgi:D-alanyl-D-alanine carboxypeptidase
VTTARDLAVLSRALWLDFPEYRHYFAISAIKHGKQILRSHNTLLERYRGANGLKTGFICSSGFNMVASATKNGRTLIAVVLGAESSEGRAETAARLMNQAFASWGPLKPQQLAAFQSTPVFGTPVNMRDQVCGKRVPKEDDEASRPVIAGAVAPSSALVPRFVLMDPVVVFTGGVDRAPGETSVAATAGNVPMPRINPRRNPVTDGTANAFAPAAKGESPIDILTAPAPGTLGN